MFSDGGVGHPDAFNREQKHNPAGPRFPDPPAGVVRVRLSALVSNTCTQTPLTFFITLFQQDLKAPVGEPEIKGRLKG